ncbi:MAG: hypothetical protein R3190_04725 [Thermoanaerobaculia bacterium]|nr:hypothetical protein [Thermoanaerobaculia bacterium]
MGTHSRRAAVASRRLLLVAVAFCAGAARLAAEPPRTEWGDPDLRGVWDYRTLTPLERPYDLAGKEVLSAEEAAALREQTLERLDFDNREGGARIDVERAYNDFWWDWGDELTADRRTSLIVDPPDGRVPPMTEAAKKAMAAQRDRRPVRAMVVIGSKAWGPEDLGLSERCLLGFNAGPPMLPSAYNNNVQIFQTEDTVAILNEMVHQARIVPLDGRSRPGEDVRQWLGIPRGRWEGETLVVESTGFTDKTPSFSTILGAMGTGERLRLIERFTRVAPDTLLYEFTVDDPATFTRTFSAAIPMRAASEPIYEYACHEGNYGMTNLLRGARAQEAEAKR